MNKKSKPDVVRYSVIQAKDSEFGVTAIKVELEANLYRDSTCDWESQRDCYDWLMCRLQALGLAEFLEDNYHELNHGYDSQWHPTGALKYAEFYNDGSVDSELTFTLSLEDPNNIFLLPKILRIWNEFMDAVSEDSGEEPDMHGAGMHMAFLNTSDCHYPSRFNSAQIQRFDNFKRSMTLLLPSLYFLGSTDHQSRPLEYREPRVTIYDGGRDWGERRTFKFSAVTFNQGALEFRVFNTCYDNPEAILDNVVVMSNAVRKYWRSAYRPSGMEKITSRVYFGNDSSHDLSRFYVTGEHVDLLNEGLRRLKPSYYTIRQLKEQRDFGLTKRSVNGTLARIKREALVQYREYESRFTWERRMNRYRYIQRHIADAVAQARDVTALQEAEVIAEAQRVADTIVQSEESTKQSVESFIEEQVHNYQRRNTGRWTLEVA